MIGAGWNKFEKYLVNFEFVGVPTLVRHTILIACLEIHSIYALRIPNAPNFGPYSLRSVFKSLTSSNPSFRYKPWGAAKTFCHSNLRTSYRCSRPDMNERCPPLKAQLSAHLSFPRLPILARQNGIVQSISNLLVRIDVAVEPNFVKFCSDVYCRLIVCFPECAHYMTKANKLEGISKMDTFSNWTLGV